MSECWWTVTHRWEITSTTTATSSCTSYSWNCSPGMLHNVDQGNQVLAVVRLAFYCARQLPSSHGNSRVPPKHTHTCAMPLWLLWEMGNQMWCKWWPCIHTFWHILSICKYTKTHTHTSTICLDWQGILLFILGTSKGDRISNAKMTEGTGIP